MQILKSLVVFLIINFGGLAIGNWLMADGPRTAWYADLTKAPWTPPGWVFGASWTTIMICFSIYMAYLYKEKPTINVKVLFAIQFVLNVIWNFIFFNQHLILLGLIVISVLTIIVSVFLFGYRKTMKIKSLLILPYVVWLCIATSLNLYIYLNN